MNKAKGDNKSGRKPGRRWPSRLGWITLGLSIYFLSVGPTVWIWEHTRNPMLRDSIENMAAVTYWPLGQTAKCCQPFEKLLNAYVDIWS